MASERKWTATSDRLPPDGVVVETKIDDSDGLRNERRLKRQGNLWFLADGSMYVYYRPTHWRPHPMSDPTTPGGKVLSAEDEQSIRNSLDAIDDRTTSGGISGEVRHIRRVMDRLPSAILPTPTGPGAQSAGDGATPMSPGEIGVERIYARGGWFDPETGQWVPAERPATGKFSVPSTHPAPPAAGPQGVESQGCEGVCSESGLCQGPVQEFVVWCDGELVGCMKFCQTAIDAYRSKGFVLKSPPPPAAPLADRLAAADKALADERAAREQAESKCVAILDNMKLMKDGLDQLERERDAALLLLHDDRRFRFEAKMHWDQSIADTGAKLREYLEAIDSLQSNSAGRWLGRSVPDAILSAAREEGPR